MTTDHPTPGRRWIQATTLGDLLDRHASEHPEREALVLPAARAGYGELADRAQQLARRLIGLGVGRGDRVGILLPASSELVAALFATAKIGAVAVPVNARFKSRELRHVITHSGMRVLLTAAPEPGAPDLLTEAFPELSDRVGDRATMTEAPELEHVMTLGDSTQPRAVAGTEGGDETVAAAQESVRVRDTAVLVYTSGTTATPKGAMLSHEALTRLADGIATDRLPLAGPDRVWTAIPLFHGGGITFLLTAITAGATFVHAGQFDPAATPSYLARERVTIALAAFETIWLPVLNQPDFAEYDLDSIRVVMVVGVPERLREMAARLPQAVHISCVAMTESSAFLSLNRLDDPLEKRVTTGGHPMPGMQCRIVDPDTGDDLPAGQRGELLFRGPNTFDGYFRDPELTARSFDDAGWFHSGDLVTFDAEGRITFESRLKDMLKVGGENVSAAEVEGFLLGHPAVDIVAVVAAPDAYYVEVPTAFVQLSPDASATATELIDYCLGRIATYRVPRYVRFIADASEWPMSGTKIQKHVLREQIAEELRRAGITQAPRLNSGELRGT